MRRQILVLVLALGGCASACTTGPATAKDPAGAQRKMPPVVSSTTTTVPTGTASAFEAEIDSVNAARATFRQRLGLVSLSGSSTSLSALSQSLQRTYRDFSGFLVSHQWPAISRVDVRILVSGLGAVAGDLQSLSFEPGTYKISYPATWQADNGGLANSTRQVRSDLGLPPLPASTIPPPASTTTSTIPIASKISALRSSIAQDQQGIAYNQEQLAQHQQELSMDQGTCTYHPGTSVCYMAAHYQELINYDQSNIQAFQAEISSLQAQLASLGAAP